MDKDSATDNCQALPWIITKDMAGADLPKFNNKLLLEFGWKDAFVRSLSATSRKIEIIPDTDDRRKPNRDRKQYYDLPETWKSACYFTRFSDSTKNKFFDELLATDDPDLEGSCTKATKLTFSLDDIVLVKAGSQDVKDRDYQDNDVDRSEYSRVTILYLDPADKYKIKVHAPRINAAYWSDLLFQKETGASTVYRNAVADGPINPRVVVFCDGFHDVFDKRTTTATFASKEILGARAAVLEDTDISSPKTVFNGPSALTDAYVHRLRLFHLHYLHYGETDGTTVYGALVTFWNCRFTLMGPEGGTDAIEKVYREEGMERAMTRWNEKDYTFEQEEDKNELVVKHFCLFEAKDVENPSGNYEWLGGAHICEVNLKDDAHGGSSASADGTEMTMRASGAVDEGSDWGPVSATNPLDPVVEYGGGTYPSSAFSHELGHAAIGLWDDYVTGKLSITWGGPNDTADSRALFDYNDNDDEGDRQGQRYLGMPYELDEQPLMKTNRAVRLRYFWGRTKWLNDQTAPGLGGFLAGKRFRIAYEPAGADKLKYIKPAGAAYESIYKPSFSAPAWSLGRQGQCDLHLYHLGEDEFSKTLDGGPYNGILVLCLKMSASFPVPVFDGKTAYKRGDFVELDGTQYKCKADFTPTVTPFSGSATYAANAVVEIDGSVYKCIAGFTPVIGDLSGRKDYAAGDLVRRAGKIYSCKADYTTGLLEGLGSSIDTAKWQEVAAGVGYTMDATTWQKVAPGEGYTMDTAKWAAADAQLLALQKIAHMEDLNRRILTMVQGKFKLQGSGNFSTTYIRIFPQWEVVDSAAAATGNTNFNITFQFGSTDFAPAGTTIVAGTGCKPKSIIRYMLGKIGDVAGNWDAEGGVDGDLTKEDFPQLKAWMDANAGGRFNVGLI